MWVVVNVSLLRSRMVWFLAVISISMVSNSVNLWHSFYTDGWLDSCGHSRESTWDEHCGRLDQTDPAPEGGLGDLHSNHKWCQTRAVAQVFTSYCTVWFTFTKYSIWRELPPFRSTPFQTQTNTNTCSKHKHMSCQSWNDWQDKLWHMQKKNQFR